jgi:hypothetical protein
MMVATLSEFATISSVNRWMRTGSRNTTDAGGRPAIQ